MPRIGRPRPSRRTALLPALLAVAAIAAALVLVRRRRAGGGLEAAGPGGDPGAHAGGTADDARLLARVESELFRDPALPKGDIVLDAVGGVVTLRGAVDAALVEEIGVRVAAVEGVVRVDNRLHRPGAPPPA
jgi:hypothetical protein